MAGPTLMIKVGSDLVTLQMLGVEDVHAAAKRVVAIAGPRVQ